MNISTLGQKKKRYSTFKPSCTDIPLYSQVIIHTLSQVISVCGITCQKAYKEVKGIYKTPISSHKSSCCKRQAFPHFLFEWMFLITSFEQFILYIKGQKCYESAKSKDCVLFTIA